MGVIEATRNVAIGESAFMSYGDNYNWDGYKVTLVRKLGQCLVAGMRVAGHSSFRPFILGVRDELDQWSALDLQNKRLGSAFEKLVMAVVE